MKSFDKGMAELERQDKLKKEYSLILDKQVSEVQSIDLKIDTLKEQKKRKLQDVSNVMDLAMVQKHSLANGYTVKNGNIYTIEVTSTAEFLKWLKQNCEPHEVLDFLDRAIKSTELKKFASKMVNKLRDSGEIDPQIGGVKIHDMTYRRLTTEKGKSK